MLISKPATVTMNICWRNIANGLWASHASRTPSRVYSYDGSRSAGEFDWLAFQTTRLRHKSAGERISPCRWAKKSTLSLDEKKAFHAERTHPSNRRYRITRSAPSRPDEMGWLILTWPIWNFYGWKWAHIAEALIKKFEFWMRRGSHWIS